MTMSDDSFDEVMQPIVRVLAHDRSRRCQEALTLIRSRQLDSAEAIIRTLLPGDESFMESTHVFDFNNPLEHAWFRCTRISLEAPTTSVVRYLEAYQLYAYLLVERRQYGLALQMLDRAQARNPVAVMPRFERADIYKRMHWADETWKEALTCFERAYQPAHLARCYRDFGFVLAERQQWERAVACLYRSLCWEDNPMARRELLYIGLRSGKTFDEGEIRERTPALLQAAGVPNAPSRLWIELSIALARHSIESQNAEQARQYYRLAHRLSGEAWILLELERH